MFLVFDILELRVGNPGYSHFNNKMLACFPLFVLRRKSDKFEYRNKRKRKMKQTNLEWKLFPASIKRSHIYLKNLKRVYFPINLYDFCLLPFPTRIKDYILRHLNRQACMASVATHTVRNYNVFILSRFLDLLLVSVRIYTYAAFCPFNEANIRPEMTCSVYAA